MDVTVDYTGQNLSARQRDVMKLIIRGLSNKEIADDLNLAEGTVKIHVAALLRKLGVNRRAAVAAVLMNCGGIGGTLTTKGPALANGAQHPRIFYGSGHRH